MSKNPGFTLITVLTLAIGIGANSLIFSLVNAAIINPFPYPDANRLVVIQQSLPKIGITNHPRSSGVEFTDYQTQINSLENIAAIEPVSRNLSGGEEPERLSAAKVSGEFFALLGVKPLHGRTIVNGDQANSNGQVLVISYGLWQRRFGGQMNVLGQKFALDDEPYTIIGIMPPQFRYEVGEAWFPFPFDLKNDKRNNRGFLVIGKLKAAITIEQARQEFELLARRQEQQFKDHPEYINRQFTITKLADSVLGTTKPALFILLGAVGLVLLIACANIANLLLARAVTREHEMSIRMALGATRGRLLRQLVIESLMMALLGGAIGFLLMLWGKDAALAVIPTGSLPPGIEIKLDTTVWLFTLATTTVTALLFGLWPALQATRIDSGELLKQGGSRVTLSRYNRRLQNIFVVAEIALSLLLLIMASLLLRSFVKLSQIDPGFNTERLLSMRINLPQTRYKDNRDKATFFQQAITNTEKIPGVAAVAVASHMPFVYTESWSFNIEDSPVQNPADRINIDTRTVSKNYFRVLNIPLLTGMEFTDFDNEQAEGVVIINHTLARRFWPNSDAIGKRIKLNRFNKVLFFTIKGVVADSAQNSLENPIQSEVYFPLTQMAVAYRRMNLAVRTQNDPQSAIAGIKSAIMSIDKDQPIYQIQTVDEMIAESIAVRRFAMVLLIIFASIALLLSAIGIYGVISFSVTQRTQEIGIRMSLGAQSRDILKMVLFHGIKLIFAGLVLGLGISLLTTRLLVSLLYGISAFDPITFVMVSAILILLALLACYLPARRATRIEPIIALRYE